VHTVGVTVFGAGALSFMMATYALEGRQRRFVAAFAAGWPPSSASGFLAGALPFGVVEVIWSAVAFRRFRWLGPGKSHQPGP
jgi:hypothetical protein